MATCSMEHDEWSDFDANDDDTVVNDDWGDEIVVNQPDDVVKPNVLLAALVFDTFVKRNFLVTNAVVPATLDIKMKSKKMLMMNRNHIDAVFVLHIPTKPLNLSDLQRFVLNMYNGDVIDVTMTLSEDYGIIVESVLMNTGHPMKLSWALRRKLTGRRFALKVDRSILSEHVAMLETLIDSKQCLFSHALQTLRENKWNISSAFDNCDIDYTQEWFPDVDDTNFLTQTAAIVIDTIQNACTFCLACDGRLSNPGFVPSVCDSQLCVSGNVMFGFGMDLVAELFTDEDASDLYITLFINGASVLANVEDVKSPIQNVDFKEDVFQKFELCVDGTYQYTRMATVLAQHCPSIEAMKESAKHLKQHLDSIHCMLYPILHWLFMTKSCYLRTLKDSEKKTNIETTHQFVLMLNSPEKEREFVAEKEKTGKSFLAYHGAPPENWFSILKSGLKIMSQTKFMTSGAAHGNGIYMAAEYPTSLAYSVTRRNQTKWKHSKIYDTETNNIRILAHCEVAYQEKNLNLVGTDIYSTKNVCNVRKQPHGYGYIVAKIESIVSTRYLYVYKYKTQVY